MRLVAQFVLGISIIVGSSQLRAAETKSRWWPFSGSDESAAPAAVETTPPQVSAAIRPTTAAQQMPLAQQTSTAAPSATQGPPPKDPPKSVAVDRGWSWPPIHLPEFSTLSPPQMPSKNWNSEPQMDVSRNTWYEEATPARPSPWQAMKSSTQRVRQGTRNAWDKTVDVFTPGDDDNARVSRRDPPKPPLWKRMFGVEEEKQEGPLTVTEWMAQERLDP